MATPVITHRKVSGKAAGTDSTRVYGTHWDDSHVVTGLENVDNTSDASKPVSTAQAAADAVVAANAANASNLTSGTVAAARMPALTGDVTTSAGAVATTLATVNSNVGSFGSATQTSQVTVNGKGLVTAAANVTITPAVGSITGLGTGVATALAVNVGTAGAPVVNGGALGTPSSGTGTNLTGIPTTALTGTLQAAQEPAHTGDVTNSAGSLALAIDPLLLRGYLAGLTLSTAGSSATFGIAAGVAVDSTNAGFMKLASAYTKTTSSWAVGTATGSLDTGAIANSTWYHAFLIKRVDTGVVDVLISLSATAPTMPTNYTLFRCIGSMKTNGSAQWTKFIQDGDDFQWDVPVVDVNTVQNPGTAAVTRTLSVPTGIRVQAIISALAQTNGTAATPGAFLISDLSIADSAASASAFSVYVYSGSLLTLLLGTQGKVYTNTSGQVRTRIQTSNTDAFIYINTHGWTYRRGRDA